MASFYDKVQQPKSPIVASFFAVNHDPTLNTARLGRRNKRIDSHETIRHMFGVHKKKDSGKYTSEIRNHISRKIICLGNYGTAEEVAQTYQPKKSM